MILLPVQRCERSRLEVHLWRSIPAADRDAVLEEAVAWAANRVQEKDDDAPAKVPPVQVASFEAFKGASAQYVFLLALQAGDMPRNPTKLWAARCAP
jgi:superfamily I DNA/RNA helicase